MGGFRAALFGERHINPASEEVLRVPFALAVAEQYEGVSHGPYSPTPAGSRATEVGPMRTGIFTDDETTTRRRRDNERDAAAALLKQILIAQFGPTVLLELGEEIGHCHRCLLNTINVEDDFALMHHDEAIAHGEGLLHIVGDHEGG